MLLALLLLAIFTFLSPLVIETVHTKLTLRVTLLWCLIRLLLTPSKWIKVIPASKSFLILLRLLLCRLRHLLLLLFFIKPAKLVILRKAYWNRSKVSRKTLKGARSVKIWESTGIGHALSYWGSIFKVTLLQLLRLFRLFLFLFLVLLLLDDLLLVDRRSLFEFGNLVAYFFLFFWLIIKLICSFWLIKSFKTTFPTKLLLLFFTFCWRHPDLEWERWIITLALEFVLVIIISKISGSIAISITNLKITRDSSQSSPSSLLGLNLFGQA